MTRNSKILLIGCLTLIAVWPTLPFIGPVLGSIQFVSDRSIIMYTVGFISFMIGFLLDPLPNNKTLWLPVIFALCFTLFPIASEFNPDNVSKGWSVLIFIVSFFGSLVGTILGLAAGRFARKMKKNK